MTNDNQLGALLRTGATSRAHLLKATAIAGTIAAAGTLAPSVLAGRSLVEAAATEGGDLAILNYALTLEHLEDALYRVLIASGLLKGKALTYAIAFGGHEHAHVVALTATITKLGGTPVQPMASYKFPTLLTAADIIQTLASVEDLGASAYLGAAPLIQNPAVLSAAVEIHTVEAEHATTWHLMANIDALPFSFAPPSTMKEVLAVVTPLL